MKIRTMICVIGIASGAHSSMAFATDQQSVLAGGIELLCKAQGASAVSSSMEQQVEVKAELKFKLSEQADGLRVIKDLRGEIMLGAEQQATGESYIGKFEDESAVENAKYRPRVYKGFSQFKNINAVVATGSQTAAMVGTLLVEKDVEKEQIKAHYLFQAGDSIGGVLHLTCSRAD